MRQFILGVMVGATIMGTAVGAVTYDRNGKPNAPAGSIEQFNYFRERQQQLDISHMRRQADQDRLNRMTNPCAK